MSKTKKEIKFDKWWKNQANAANLYEFMGKYLQRDRVEKEMLEKLNLFNKENE